MDQRGHLILDNSKSEDRWPPKIKYDETPPHERGERKNRPGFLVRTRSPLRNLEFCCFDFQLLHFI